MRMRAPGAQEFVPDTDDLADLAGAVRGCRGCDLYQFADQAVFGTGSPDAQMMLVGEQPGDQEDRAGLPFVGPAGRLLDNALAAADVDRERVYITNAVKHFKFTRAERGKRRIHKTPSRTEVVACRPWLIAELTAVQPDVVVLMGATAAKSLMGNDFRLTQHRAEAIGLPDDDPGLKLDFSPAVVVTVHPSSVLRAPAKERDTAFAALAADLRFAGGLLV